MGYDEKIYNSLMEIKKGEMPFFNELSLNDFFGSSCVYFLLNNNKDKHKSEIIYIGITKCLMNRINQHYSENSKDCKKGLFNSFSFIKCDDDIINELEEILITFYNPKLNKNKTNWFYPKYIKYISDYMRTNEETIRNDYLNNKNYDISFDDILNYYKNPEYFVKYYIEKNKNKFGEY